MQLNQFADEKPIRRSSQFHGFSQNVKAIVTIFKSGLKFADISPGTSIYSGLSFRIWNNLELIAVTLLMETNYQSYLFKTCI